MKQPLWHPYSALVHKELKARYARPYLGFLWALLVPLVMATVLYLVFVVFLRMRIEGVPFFVHLFSAVFPWAMFQDTLRNAAGSIVNNRVFVRESRIPLVLVPAAAATASAISALPGLLVMITGVSAVMHGFPSAAWLLLATVVQTCLAAALGALAALCFVRWRDTLYVIDLMLQVGFYLIPSFYSYEVVAHTLPAWAQRLYGFNPFVGIVHWYRLGLVPGYAQLAGGFLDAAQLAMPVIATAVAIAAAWCAYARSTKSINDYLAF